MRISDWSSDVCSSDLIPAARLTVITGGSGAGKTTLTDLLLGLHRPADGRILIDGTSLAETDLAKCPGMVGSVPQDPVLSNASVAANGTLGTAPLSHPPAAPPPAPHRPPHILQAPPQGLPPPVRQ